MLAKRINTCDIRLDKRDWSFYATSVETSEVEVDQTTFPFVHATRLDAGTFFILGKRICFQITRSAYSCHVGRESFFLEPVEELIGKSFDCTLSDDGQDASNSNQNDDNNDGGSRHRRMINGPYPGMNASRERGCSASGAVGAAHVNIAWTEM